MNRSQQQALGVEVHAMREVEVTPGETVSVGGVNLTVSSLGNATDADVIVMELRPDRPGVRLVEGDDGAVRTEPMT